MNSSYAVFQIPDFRRYLAAGTLSAATSQMTSTAAGWEIYERTNQPWALGLLGFVVALPFITLALPAGTLADRKPRKTILICARILGAFALILLALASYFALPIWSFYALIGLLAMINAFAGPAGGAFVTNLVPHEQIAAATKWTSLRWNIASLVGPILAGLLIAYFARNFEVLAQSAAPIYALDAFAALLFALLISPVKPQQNTVPREELNWSSVVAGWHFIKARPLVFGSISLDMVAVLFGGATALIPIYARDILMIGPEALGPLRAAPAAGAMLMSLVLAHIPPLKRAGKTLLWAVAGFGAATIVFGLSKNLWLSLGALATLGACDQISVYVRHTLLQLVTPDAMRGRVGAVNSIFISTSNEIGELESGLAAQVFGPVLAVAGGGAVTILVVAFVAWKVPVIRRLRRLEDLKPQV